MNTRIIKTAWRTVAAFAIVVATSAALTLTALADLPSGYRQLDYIDTDGTQWVNTLFEPTCTNAVEIKASVADPTTTQFLYCSRRTTISNADGKYRRYHSLCVDGGKARFDYSTWTNLTSELTAGQTYVIAASPEVGEGQEEIAEENKQWHLNGYIDGTQVLASADRIFWVPANDGQYQYFCLFGGYAGDLNENTTVGSLATCRFYYFKVWDTKDRENLLCHIIPVCDETKAAIGLYDLVAQRFLPAHGGTLTGGYELNGDVDRTQEGPLLLGADTTLDLAGHSLKTAGVAEYIPLDYVETDGSQWVNTEFTPAGTDTIELKFRMRRESKLQFLVCSRKGAGAGDGGFGLDVTAEGEIEFIRRSRGGPGKYTGPVSTNEDYVALLNSDKRFWTVSGTAIEGTVTNDFSTTQSGSQSLTTYGPFALFCGHSAGTSLSPTSTIDTRYVAECRFYYFKVWDKNGNLKCHIIPAYGVNEDVVGLYDVVNGKFLRSIKSGGALTTFAKTYHRLPYIDTNGKQYVNTNFKPSWTNRVEMCVRMFRNDVTQGLFCSRQGTTTRTYTCFAVNNGTFRFDYSKQKDGCAYETGVDYEIVMSPVEGVDANDTPCLFADCTVNGVAAMDDEDRPYIAQSSVEGYPVNTYARLFASHEDGKNVKNFAYCRFYSYKVYDTPAKENILCDIYPAISVKDGKVGLYDCVNDRFLTSIGDEPFPIPFSPVITNSASARATLEVSVADGAVVTNSLVTFASGIDFTKSGEGAWAITNGLDVVGTFKPVAGTVDGIVMQNGATLDLSGRADAFSLDDNAISFADGASIAIALGSRTVSTKTPLVSWTTAPVNIATLKFVKGDGQRGMIVKSDGVYLAPNGLIISFH